MTDFLFARPSFIGGMARTLDLGGAFDAYNVSLTEQIADARAMLADWAAVGNDIRDAADKVASEHVTGSDDVA